MKRSLFLVLALFSAVAWAGPAMVFKDENVTVRITQDPCKPPVSKMVTAPNAKAGTALWNGRTLRLCWWMAGQGMVGIVDEDGDGGALPIDQFKPAPSS